MGWIPLWASLVHDVFVSSCRSNSSSLRISNPKQPLKYYLFPIFKYVGVFSTSTTKTFFFLILNEI